MEYSHDTFLLGLGCVLIVACVIGIGAKVYGRLTRKKKNIKRGLAKRF